MKKDLRDFDKLIEHRKITNKIVHNPVSIEEIEKVLNSLVISKTEEIIYTSEKGYNEFNRLMKESWEKFIKDKNENFEKEKLDILDKINLYKDCKEFEKQKFIRDYHKLLNDV